MEKLTEQLAGARAEREALTPVQDNPALAGVIALADKRIADLELALTRSIALVEAEALLAEIKVKLDPLDPPARGAIVAMLRDQLRQYVGGDARSATRSSATPARSGSDSDSSAWAAFLRRSDDPRLIPVALALYGDADHAPVLTSSGNKQSKNAHGVVARYARDLHDAECPEGSACPVDPASVKLA